MTLLSDPTEEYKTRDEMLTNMMIYWVTETSALSVRSYYASAQAQDTLPSETVDNSRLIAWH